MILDDMEFHRNASRSILFVWSCLLYPDEVYPVKAVVAQGELDRNRG